MYQYLRILLFGLIVFSVACTPKKQIKESIQSKAKKVLFICTSTKMVNGNANGTFLSEIAIPFILLEDEDIDIDIVSPQGGAIPIYYKFDTTEIISRALNSDFYHQQISNSFTPEEVNYKDYSAIIIPGGYGQFWDIHENNKINELVAKIYENGGIIGALGHGTSSLINVILSNDQPLVKGVVMTCFPSWFEKEIMTGANYGKLLPFDMEEALLAQGADLKKVDKETRSNGQIIDEEHRIITASNATGGEYIVGQLKRLLSEE